MWLTNISRLIVGHKTSEGIIDQIDFLSQYHLRLKYCLSYLYSFLELIERKVTTDDLQTIHCFAYIPQLIDTSTDQNLPSIIPFRYTQINRSTRRHETFFLNVLSNFFNDRIKTNRNQSIKMRKNVIHIEKELRVLFKQQQSNQRKAKKKTKLIFVVFVQFLLIIDHILFVVAVSETVKLIKTYRSL